MRQVYCSGQGLIARRGALLGQSRGAVSKHLSNRHVGGEARITNSAGTADWINTEYNNQSSPSTFYTVGAQTSR
jgi:hypothetical protein